MKFERNQTTGDAKLRVGDEQIELQSPLKPSTHFQLSTTQAWHCDVADHQIDIVKVRPRFLGGMRANTYTVSVDDRKVATSVGT
jgi:hypothetical protein